MYFYKTLNEDGTLKSIQSGLNDVSGCDSSLIPISQEEFDEISAEMDKKLAEEEGFKSDEISPEEFLQLIEEAF